ncbi:ABC transporter permease [Paenibacillus sp. 7124]|uniref:ABC transporter permease n=1 Tax=Paenibacillus apii TaxID=1850370 RepID=A0A6M1PKZ2_9BACL|nr:ABC transporter permease [Paenibacillus apii]NGM82553.1 ABC transporter permease [Paenibacillus apii]
MFKLKKIFVTDSYIVPLVAILLGLLVGAIVMLIGGYDPIAAYGALFNRVFGSPYDFGEAIREMTPLMLTGLSVAFAFRSGLFNIGADGQVLIGMTVASLIGIKWAGLPMFLLVPLAVIGAGLFGGLWAGIAGYLKAKRGINEVITTIMMNWVALYLANYIVRTFLLIPGQDRSEDIPASLSITFLVSLFDNARIHWGTIIALAAALFFYIYLWKTKQGFEMRAVGLNPHAAEYAGMNVSRNVMKSMFIAGMFAGLAGAGEVLGVFHYQSVFAASPGYGFDGIAVALLGLTHPLGVILAAILYGMLTYGSAGMSFNADVPPELIRIVIGSIIFFIAAQGIVRWVLRPFYFKRKKEKVL